MRQSGCQLESADGINRTRREIRRRSFESEDKFRVRQNKLQSEANTRVEVSAAATVVIRRHQLFHMLAGQWSAKRLLRQFRDDLFGACFFRAGVSRTANKYLPPTWHIAD